MLETIFQHFESTNSRPGVGGVDRVLASLLKTNPNLVYEEALEVARDLQPGALWTTEEVAKTIAKILRPEVAE